MLTDITCVVMQLHRIWILSSSSMGFRFIEWKNAADANATVRNAFNQFQTYKNDIGSIFTYNGLLAISDGIDAQLGTLTADV